MIELPAVREETVGHGHAVGWLVFTPLVLLPTQAVHTTAHSSNYEQSDASWNVFMLTVSKPSFNFNSNLSLLLQLNSYTIYLTTNMICCFVNLLILSYVLNC